MRALTCYLALILSFSTYAASFSYGSYTGNGTSQSITGVGFLPAVVLIKSENSYAAVVSTSSMSSGYSKLLTGTSKTATGHISSLDADGFSISSSNQVNKSAVVYNFVAWEDDAALDVGSYTGDPGSVSVGYRPGMVWLLGDEDSWPDYGSYSFDSHSGTDFRFQDGTGTEDNIGSFTASGFNVGADANTSAKTYHYVTFKNDDDVWESTFTGSGSDGYEITDAGTDVQFAMVKRSGNTPGYFKSRSMAAGESFAFGTNSASSNSIKNWTSSGFTLGTNTDVNAAGSFFASKGGGVLPVELIYFKANLITKAVKVEWQTASEVNSSHFLVERSTDGEIYKIIGEVSAAGNSDELIAYEFIDYFPNESNNYYRLKQIDFDDAFEYYNTVVVNANTGTELTHVNLYPNPVLDDVNFYFDSRDGGTYQIKIYNQLGVEVHSTTIFAVEGGNEARVNVMLYDAGYYIAKMTGPDDFSRQMKFYKRN